MKTNYNYFLQRRNLTTKTIVETNQIKSYSELVVLLELLKVEPPPLKDVETYFIKEEVNNEKTKAETKKKSSTRHAGKKKTARSKTSNASRNVSKKSEGSSTTS